MIILLPFLPTTTEIIMIPLEGPKSGQEIDLTVNITRNPEIGHVGAQFYLHEGWAIMNNHVAINPPSGEFRKVFNKIWAVQLDESAEDRGENALARFYGNLHTFGTKTTTPTNVINIPYPNANRDMTKVFANIWVGTAGSPNHSEAYVIERNVLHGDEIPLTSGGGDVTAPAVSAVTVSTTSTTATIDWTWDEAATGQVSYGTTVSEGTLSTEETNYLNRHVQTLGEGINLPALESGTTYYYTITGADVAGNNSSEPQRTFTTDGATPENPGVAIGGLVGAIRGATGAMKIILQ